MSSMKEIEELYNQLKNRGYYNTCLNEDNLTIYFDERYCMILYPNYYKIAWGLNYDEIGRCHNVVYTFDENDTLTITASFYEISINLKGYEP